MAAPQTAPQDDYFAKAFRPTCPSVLIPWRNELYALPIHKLDVECEFNVSTAFVKITGRWKNIAAYESDCLFVLPLNGTVTSVDIEIRERVLSTVVVPNDELAKLGKKGGPKEDPNKPKEPQEGKLPPNMSFDKYIPNLFRLPIQGVKSGDIIKVVVVFIEPLEFRDNKYQFTLPLTFGQTNVPDGKRMSDVISIKCAINSVCEHTNYSSMSHKITPVPGQNLDEAATIHLEVSGFDKPLQKGDTNRTQGMPGQSNESTLLVGTKDQASRSVDFHLAYDMRSLHILPTCISEMEEDGVEGSFLLFVTPPSNEYMDTFFARDMIFLLDRSGSMTGEPHTEACRALHQALTLLNPSDRFTIVAFDHTQAHFSSALVPATPENVQNGSSWVNSYQPARGGTDIMTPLHWALSVLGAEHSAQMEGGRHLPFVVLLTDGCVADEREICASVEPILRSTRILTFGIGSYCNWMFLRMLAKIGRGFSDVVLSKDKIYPKITQLLSMASVPVLTDVEIGITGVSNVQLYPHPVPDLFMGAPITISGHFKGQFPDQIELRAMKADGTTHQSRVNVRESKVIPVGKVFVKQRLDLLSAQAWRTQATQAIHQVTELSVQESMPSAYTTMVVHEMTQEEKKQLDEESERNQAKGKKGKWNTKKGKLKNWAKNNKKVLAALSVGTAVVIGAAAFSFGDVASSANNLPVGGGMDGGGGDFGDSAGGGCEDCDCDCGDCECDCGDCLAC